MFRLAHWARVLLVGGLACSRPTPEAAPLSDTRRPMRVLFIGNSYTFQNDLPARLGGFVQALSPGTRWETGSVLTGGATLASHWAQGEARRRLHEERWDAVVLQEQSLLGHLSIDGVMQLNEPEASFFPAARLFARESRGVGARPLFFMTWSREGDLPAQEVLTRAYARIAREERGELSAVGVAWLRVRRERPDVALYAEDGHHPAPAGTYLAACVLYASLFHQPCVGAPGPGPQARDVTHYLQQVGSEVGLATELPESGEASPTPVFPQLPRGAPLDAARGVGTWKGSLALYPAELGMTPMPLRLSLETRGERLSGRVRLDFPRGPPLEVDVTPRVEQGELSFSFEDPVFLETTVHARAVLERGGWRGVARAEDAQGGRWFGSWSARPAPEGSP